MGPFPHLRCDAAAIQRHRTRETRLGYLVQHYLPTDIDQGSSQGTVLPTLRENRPPSQELRPSPTQRCRSSPNRSTQRPTNRHCFITGESRTQDQGGAQVRNSNSTKPKTMAAYQRRLSRHNCERQARSSKPTTSSPSKHRCCEWRHVPGNPSSPTPPSSNFLSQQPPPPQEEYADHTVAAGGPEDDKGWFECDTCGCHRPVCLRSEADPRFRQYCESAEDAGPWARDTIAVCPHCLMAGSFPSQNSIMKMCDSRTSMNAWISIEFRPAFTKKVLQLSQEQRIKMSPHFPLNTNASRYWYSRPRYFDQCTSYLGSKDP